jgi:hypothetical protein
VPRFTADDRDKMIKLHKAHASRNQIAKDLGFSTATITVHAQRAGLHFERHAELAKAVETRRLSLAERRAALAEKLMDLAEAAAQDVQDQYVITALGVDQGVSFWTSQTLDRAPAKERLDLIKISQQASAQSMRLIEFDKEADSGAAEARGMLQELSDAARALADSLPE